MRSLRCDPGQRPIIKVRIQDSGFLLGNPSVSGWDHILKQQWTSNPFDVTAPI